MNTEKIIEELAECMGVSVKAIHSKSRKRELVITRQIAHFCAKQLTGLTLKSIGQAIGGRDHTTVINSIKCVNDMYDTQNDEFMACFKKLPHMYKVLISRDSATYVIKDTLRMAKIKIVSLKCKVA